MNEMRGHYEGVDSATLTNIGRTDLGDFISLSRDTLALAERPDMSAHLVNLRRDGVVSSQLCDARHALTKINTDEKMKCLTKDCGAGATYITLEDAIDLETSSKQKTAKVLRVTDANGYRSDIYFSPPWPDTIIHVHPFADKWGCHFHIVPLPRAESTFDTRILWITNVLLIHSCELWKTIAKNVVDTDSWCG